MAGNYYNHRAEDALSLFAHIDTFINIIERRCKDGFAKSISRTLATLTQKKKSLEACLEGLCDDLKKASMFKRFGLAKKIREIKNTISATNKKIVEWINGTYRHIGMPLTSLHI